jgi:peptidoglycan/LPS O-acetylase OafA/YrhL
LSNKTISHSIFSDIKETPLSLAQKKYPSLNGLRAVSIIMVVISHLVMLYPSNFGWLSFLGPLGVNIFFVISGFLITTLCIKEKVETSTISLKNFYLRRAFRILPVAYLYILILAVLNFIFKLNMASAGFIAAIFFLADLSFSRRTNFNWDVSHYWSLSVEEQFYLFFPVFIKKNFRMFVLLILVVVFAPPILFYIESRFAFFNSGILAAATRFISKFQSIAIGCLFSVLMFKGYFNLKKGSVNLILSAISVFIMFYIRYDDFEDLSSTFFNPIVSFFTGLLIVANIQHQKNLLYRFLNLKLLDMIGILSYSIYIWQQLFLSNDKRLFFCKIPVNLVFLAVVPVLSYFFFEKKFLAIKKRFASKNK